MEIVFDVEDLGSKQILPRNIPQDPAKPLFALAKAETISIFIELKLLFLFLPVNFYVI